MSADIVGHAGKRGELYPPKNLREAIGIHPGTKVIFRVVDSKLEVEPVPSLGDVLKMDAIAEVTLEELEQFRSDLADSLVRRT